MNPVLPEEEARQLCLRLMEELDCSPEADDLMQPGHGRMFGVLVCTDGSVYKAFSGTWNGRYVIEGYVPPVFDVEKYTAILEKYDHVIKRTPDHRMLSRQCWAELKSLYTFRCFDGSVRLLPEIFPDAPSGTGDCCAPKLLSYAYSQGKKPRSMCEFFYGSGAYGHKSFSSPCDGRCRPILAYILGLDVVYQDPDIVVVNKPSGLLSIEGKGPDKQDCVASRVRNLFEGCIAQPCIHRLDQATSGLMVLGLTKEAHDRLSADFENRRVHKEYEALVDGLILEERGTVSLPLRLDVDNRPRQIVDFDAGKEAVTDWVKLGIDNRGGRKVTRLSLLPRTGRTHQIRVHCACGLNCPVLGDRLYAQGPAADEPRLMLQARVLAFTHPVTGKPMRFELDPDF
ncbi:MAG: RluA family pseudouridine synthase [Spirochaetales bacterium]|nr:RluA family pseudouridine synthase [Spirochaetales bacterium]